MAEVVIHCRRLFAATLLVLAPACLHAQSMQDPTRPAALTGAGSNGGPAGSAGPQLQSVLIARQPGGRHVAVIDGETVRLGDVYKGARVARITPTQVELVRGKDRQVLMLATEEIEAGTAVTRAARLK